MLPPADRWPPDEAPKLEEQKARDLANTIQGFCNESKLNRVAVVGVLETVKAALLRAWFEQDEADRYGEDEDGDVEAWR